jgi:hypothetical protein
LELHVKLAPRAKLVPRAVPVHGKLGPGMGAVRCHGSLWDDRRWDALRRNEKPPRCCEVVRRRELGRRRRVQNCCDWPPRHRRRDSCRHHPR